MPHTISDDEYNHLVQRKNVADFVEPIYNDPRFGKEARALIKRAYPNLQMEGYDLEQRIEQRFDEEKKAREEEKAETRRKADADEDEKYKKIRKKTQDDYGFTDDAMSRLEKMMVDRNIGDYEAGAMLMASKEPRASEPSAGASKYWDFEKTDKFAEISKDPEKWGFNELLGAARRDEERAKTRQF